MILYGWALDLRTNLAWPLVILFFTAYGILAAFQVLQILMVDLNDGQAAAAMAANNLFRCLLGAGSTSIVVPMISSIGVGWTYTLAALVCVCFSPLLWILFMVGPRWRRAKRERQGQEIEIRQRRTEENTSTPE